MSPDEALDQLDAIYRMPPTFRWPVRTLGHAVMTVGLALLLQPTVGAVGAAFVLGLLVGLAKLPRLATLELVFPVSSRSSSRSSCSPRCSTCRSTTRCASSSHRW